jgi:ABC-type multidrug transport system ATPase subunit
VFNE